MMDLAEILTIIGAIISISLTVTGLAVWALKAAAADMKKNLEENTIAMRQDFKEFTKSVDSKLDNFHLHVDQKVESVKTHVRDLSLKSDNLTERLFEAEREMLIFRSKMGEFFVTRRELEDIHNRLNRLEPNSGQ